MSETVLAFFQRIAACRSVLLAAVIVAAVAPVPADAALRVHVHLPEGGPALSGGQPVWAERRSDGSLKVRHADPKTAQKATVFTTAANGYLQLGRLGGSPTSLALEVISGDFPPGSPAYSSSAWRYRDVYSGSPSGPLTTLEKHCALNEVAQTPQTLDVDGDNVVYYDCAANLIDITDRTTGQTTQVPGNSRGLRIAGPYVAWVAGSPYGSSDSIVVYDWQAKHLVYTIPSSAVRGRVDDLDLRVDGTIVTTIAGTPQHPLGDTLAWAAPGSPTLHSIPVPQNGYSIRLVGKMIAFERWAGRNFNEVRAEVGVTDFRGHVKILGRGADAAAGPERQFDFDGARLAWYAYDCSGATLRVTSITSRAQTDSLSHCPPTFTKPARVSNGRVVHFYLNCYGYQFEGCTGRNVALRLRHRPHTPVGEGSKAIHVTLTNQGAKLLKAHGTIRVQIEITFTDAAGTRERRHGLVSIAAS